MFDSGVEGGSWDVTVLGGDTKVALKCDKGFRAEKWNDQVSICHDGDWMGDLTRCIEDKDYCATHTNFPQSTLKGG